MKAAIVLLADMPTQNLVRRHAVALQQQYQTAFFAALLPAHISLKQTFTFEALDRLEAYLDRFAASFQPFPVELDHYYYTEAGNYGIFGLNVVETPTLRGLHNRLNTELPAVVADASANYDGETYRFHLTIELGEIGSNNPFRSCYDSLPDKAVKRTFVARQLAMFYYASEVFTPGSFICYKIWNIGENQADG